jgi:hypothetical protein
MENLREGGCKIGDKSTLNVLYIKGCSREHQLKYPIVPVYFETRQATLTIDREDVIMNYDVVSEDGKSWYDIRALTPVLTPKLSS